MGLGKLYIFLYIIYIWVGGIYKSGLNQDKQYIYIYIHIVLSGEIERNKEREQHKHH